MKAKRSKGAKHLYSSDRPIYSKNDDVLKRTKFAERLASDLKSWEGNDSLVVALYGAWGSGKTSVKNMVLEAVGRKRASAIPVMEFNPWQLSGSGEIPATFFRELGIVLGDEGPTRDIQKRAAKWKVYSGLLGLGGTIVSALGSLRTQDGKLDGLVFEAAGGGMTTAAKAANKGAEALQAKTDAEAKSLQEIKTELSALMAKLPRPILVVIDDIDRLTSDEIRQVFQLVKANADFPRLVFLLLFEREVVTSALNTISDNKGGEFLEKIIQVGYHIPQASRGAVQQALFTGIDNQLDAEFISKHWDQKRWSDLYIDGVGGYFSNLRKVKRFLASFAFHVREHCGANSFEVNPLDLIGLETLRVFEPGIFERLPGAKSILTRYLGADMFGEIKQEVVDQTVSQIVSVALPENQDKVRGILNVLFPPILSVYAGKNEVSRSHQEWLRALRVCHPDLFEKYFTLTVADDDLSQAELEILLATVADADKFKAACEALRKRDLLYLAFERLDAYKEQISLDAMGSLIQALCDMSDGFPERRPKPFSQMYEPELSVYASRLCHFGLRRQSDKKKRFHILREALLRTTGLALPFELVGSEERVANREASGHQFLVDEDDLEVLKKICIRKFRDAIERTGLRKNPHFRTILFYWGFWASADEVKTLIASQVRTAADALWLVAALLDERHSWGQQGHRVRYNLKLSALERFIEPAELNRLIERVQEGKLSKKEAIALREFRNALQRRAEGKPEVVNNAFDDSDEEVVE